MNEIKKNKAINTELDNLRSVVQKIIRITISELNSVKDKFEVDHLEERKFPTMQEMERWLI
ncbi:MAG: hypothetical protein FWC41_12260 [Firmicutes bacterium]|nr:hypothetical protein [Bacillota bacterium]